MAADIRFYREYKSIYLTVAYVGFKYLFLHLLLKTENILALLSTVMWDIYNIF